MRTWKTSNTNPHIGPNRLPRRWLIKNLRPRIPSDTPPRRIYAAATCPVTGPATAGTAAVIRKGVRKRHDAFPAAARAGGTVDVDA